jgi:hypothetical protein
MGLMTDFKNTLELDKPLREIKFKEVVDGWDIYVPDMDTIKVRFLSEDRAYIQYVEGIQVDCHRDDVMSDVLSDLGIL